MRTGSKEITLSDMERLSADPSADMRAYIAGKVAKALSIGEFTENENLIALDILRLLAHDIEVQVRAAISAQLSDCVNVPHDVVFALACDVPDVSVPLLSRSYVLSEDDLIALVASAKETIKLLAIAGRSSISLRLSQALMDTDRIEVLRTVLVNPGAALEDEQLIARWARITSEPTLLEALVVRGGLSMAIAERVYVAVADEYKQRMASMYHLPSRVLEQGAEDAREWAMLELARAGAKIIEPLPGLATLIDQLHAYNRLSCSLAVRALCTGDLDFFEAALAKRASIPRAIARLLMFDRGQLGFRSLYSRANLPETYYPAIRMLLEATLEETEYGHIKRPDLRHRIMARIQSGGFDRTVEHMDYLLNLIGRRGGARAQAQTVH